MKLLVGLMITLFAFSAFARERSVEDTIALIESDRIVKCEYVKSSFPLCIGISREFSTCRYKATYVCTGHEDFKVVLKVKSSFNNRTNGRDTVVTEVIY